MARTVSSCEGLEGDDPVRTVIRHLITLRLVSRENLDAYDTWLVQYFVGSMAFTIGRLSQRGAYDPEIGVHNAAIVEQLFLPAMPGTRMYWTLPGLISTFHPLLSSPLLSSSSPSYRPARHTVCAYCHELWVMDKVFSLCDDPPL
jgi:hypothetical protein